MAESVHCKMNAEEEFDSTLSGSKYFPLRVYLFLFMSILHYEGIYKGGQYYSVENVFPVKIMTTICHAGTSIHLIILEIGKICHLSVIIFIWL